MVPDRLQYRTDCVACSCQIAFTGPLDRASALIGDWLYV
jgi:hypothetical protein